MKKTILIINFLLPLLFACSKGNVENIFVESGFNFNSNNSEPTPWLATAIKAKKKQENKANLNVSAGYMRGFIEKRNDDGFLTNPGYGTFALERVIENKDKTNKLINFYNLPNFEDESKYMLRVKMIDDSDGIASREFSYSFEDYFDIEQITFEQGLVYYKICLLDENNELITDIIQCGISIGAIYFSKINNKILFQENEL